MTGYLCDSSGDASLALNGLFVIILAAGLVDEKSLLFGADN